jgi:hypothetical protein
MGKHPHQHPHPAGSPSQAASPSSTGSSDASTTACAPWDFADFDGYLQARCQQQARAVQQRRQARLAELGFAALDEYLQDRHVGRGWSVRRLCAEPGVGHGWMDEQLTRLGLRT